MPLLSEYTYPADLRDDEGSSSSDTSSGKADRSNLYEPKWALQSQRIRLRLLLYIAAAILVTTAVSNLALNLLVTQSTDALSLSVIPKAKFHCGKTSSEAEALGCVYDELALAWIPQVCQDLETTELFHQAGPWQYWSDDIKTRELTLEEVSRTADVGGHFWTTQRWHSVHCLFQWRKMHRAVILNGARMPEALADYHHTTHCGNVIMDELLGKDPDSIIAKGTVEMISC